MNAFYNSEVLRNLWLLGGAILKCALVTGIGPGFVAFLIVRAVYERRKTRHRAQVIEFPSWDQRTAPLRRAVSQLSRKKAQGLVP